MNNVHIPLKIGLEKACLKDRHNTIYIRTTKTVYLNQKHDKAEFSKKLQCTDIKF